MLIFPANLKEVEEVGCGGVDGDEICGWGRRGRWQCGHCEVSGPLGMVRRDRFGWIRGLATLTYSLIWMARIFNSAIMMPKSNFLQYYRAIVEYLYSYVKVVVIMKPRYLIRSREKLIGMHAAHLTLESTYYRYLAGTLAVIAVYFTKSQPPRPNLFRHGYTTSRTNSSHYYL